MSDIVERLRDWAGNYEEGSFDTEEMLMREAADEIEKWKTAFAAQSRKLQAVLDIPGVRAALKEIGGDSGT
jgi:hypothetical protein